jgi:hypothetical protein
MTPSGLSALRLAYKKATDDWVNAIRAEETLATPDHSMTAMELWDEARPKRETPTKTHFETLLRDITGCILAQDPPIGISALYCSRQKLKDHYTS